MILIDTHALIWFMFGDPRLGPRTQEHIQKAMDEGQASVAPISFWEAAMLVRKGRIALGQPTQKWVDGLMAGGIKIAALSPDIAVKAGELSDEIHGDPADRIIVATAQLLDRLLITSDRKILAYAKASHLTVLDARV
jgi:PIN domain nuclease of toxin-antitoxin system